MSKHMVTGGHSLREVVPQAFLKLDPRHVWHSPVIFVVWVGSVLTTVLAVKDPSLFAWSVAVWLWATVLFANAAEAVAEGRGKAQAASLRATKKETMARRLRKDGAEEQVPGSELRIGDTVVVEAGQVIPGDGDVIEGVATVDESAITGESAPVIRESGGDRSAVTGGTTVLSDRIVVRITTKPGESFIDRMIALVEGAERQKTPNEIALTILLTTLTIIFLVTVMALQPLAVYSGQAQSVVILVALLVCLIPTTIGALLSAIGIAGMDRLVQRNVLAMSGRAVEAAGDVSTLLLDKTGTITLGNRQASEFIGIDGEGERDLPEAAYLSSLADSTPEGKSIVDLAHTAYAWTGLARPRPSQSKAPSSSSSAPPRGCREWTFPTARGSARARAPRSRRGCARRAARCLRRSSRSRTASASPAAPRWSSPTRRTDSPPACWAWSTSRTSSSRVCVSASTTCAAWGSAR